MRTLSAIELLEVWESGRSQVPLQRALTMLAAACPEASPDSLASLTIGQRDERLLELREVVFGSAVAGLTDCPECGENIELNFNCSDIRPATGPEPPKELVVQSNGREVRFRLPTSARRSRQGTGWHTRNRAERAWPADSVAAIIEWSKR